MSQKPTKEQDIERMKEIARLSEVDAEMAHLEADDLLCNVLRRAGYSELVDEFAKVEKWYA